MTTPLRLGSVCSGYEGLGMAVASVLHVDLTWVADLDPGAAAILAHHWPMVPNLGDITAVRWEDVARVDVVCGGYPCQPFSIAGQRKGTADDRHLWPYIARALRVLRPRLAIFENVPNHLHLGFADVLADLAGLGFDAEWITLPASAVGAPHQRRRLIFIAWPADADRSGLEGRRIRGAASERHRAPAHAESDGRHEGRPEPTRLLRRLTQGEGQAVAGLNGVEWGDYGPAIERWAWVLGRPAPRPTQPGRTGERLSPRFVEWLMGLPEGHVTAPAIWEAYAETLRKRRRRFTPATARAARLKALGNGVVPQQGAAALAHLLDRIGAAA